jgi:hypothetical protein
VCFGVTAIGFSGFFTGKRYLILDRDTKYRAQFRRLIAKSRTAVIQLPPRAPNLNAYAKRLVRSIKDAARKGHRWHGEQVITQPDHVLSPRGDQGKGLEMGLGPLSGNRTWSAHCP